MSLNVSNFQDCSVFNRSPKSLRITFDNFTDLRKRQVPNVLKRGKKQDPFKVFLQLMNPTKQSRSQPAEV